MGPTGQNHEMLSPSGLESVHQIKPSKLLSLKERIVSTVIPNWNRSFNAPALTDIVYLVEDKDGKPVKDTDNAYLICTKPQNLSWLSKATPLNTLNYESLKTNTTDGRHQTKPFQLGRLLKELQTQTEMGLIKINPIWAGMNDVESVYLCEELLFVPRFDPYTHKLLMSDPKEAKALLAINPEDQKRFGVELVFHTVGTNDFLKYANEDEKLQAMEQKVHELSFQIKRTPIAKGSVSLYCVLLRLENPAQEMTFIRKYRTYNSDTNVLFVSSRLEMMTEDLEKIPYYTGEIDEIFGNIISHYNKK
ncbi:MAG: hypothetical protein ACPGJV_16330 [Bacteriovoracaceae bacterium]